MGPVVKKGPQIREEMIKDLKMKDQKCSCNKGEHTGKETLKMDIRGEAVLRLELPPQTRRTGQYLP